MNKYDNWTKAKLLEEYKKIAPRYMELRKRLVFEVPDIDPQDDVENSPFDWPSSYPRYIAEDMT